jgi:diaminopimelate epimerase
MACGSGMVAAAAASHQLGFTDAEVIVRVSGGEGMVELDGSTSWLAGPVSYAFSGELHE